jgi:hypothetical protein
VRKVTLTITLRPTPDRQKIKMESVASAKLAPANAYETVLFTGITKDGEICVVEHDPRQQEMFDPDSNVSPIRQEGTN